jgi:hypothetical protein
MIDIRKYILQEDGDASGEEAYPSDRQKGSPDASEIPPTLASTKISKKQGGKFYENSCHCCADCKYFDNDGDSGTCKISAKVRSKHSLLELNQWTSTPYKENLCYFFGENDANKSH